VVHRLDRPVCGLVIFARTSKALARLNKMFAEKEGIKKTYWAIVERRNENMKQCLDKNHSSFITLTHWLTRNEQQNKAYAHDHEMPGSKKAVLRYRTIGRGERYDLLEIELLTGRHHQIRCQLSAIGHTIRGDLKYGARRSNPDGSISLLARRIEFIHPVSQETIIAEAPLPHDTLWATLAP
jgi:23S rRNA pseudouridine1911/1915/1917 synthase